MNLGHIGLVSVILAGTTFAAAYQGTAHSGRTDSSGCHNDRKNGGYHCHGASGGGSSSGSSSPSVPLNSPINTIELPGSRPSSQPSSGSTAYAQIISVGDGDTIRVNKQGQRITVRLACIDAPEMAQAPYGTAASQRLKQLLPVGQMVTLKVVDTDRYGRQVAEVYKDSVPINLQMVREGHAVVYRQYLSGCPGLQSQLIQAENQAKQARLAFWNQPRPVMPYDFRKQNRK